MDVDSEFGEIIAGLFPTLGEKYEAYSKEKGAVWLPGILHGQVEIIPASTDDPPEDGSLPTNPDLVALSVEVNTWGHDNRASLVSPGAIHFTKDQWLAVRAEVDRILGVES